MRKERGARLADDPQGGKAPKTGGWHDGRDIKKGVKDSMTREIDWSRRHFTRVPFKTQALVKHGNRVIAGEVENLSLKGMFVRASEKIDVDEVVEIEVKFSGASSRLAMNLNGIIRWHNDKGVGIQIKDIDLDSFIHLRNVVAYNTGDKDSVRVEFLHFLKTIE